MVNDNAAVDLQSGVVPDGAGWAEPFEQVVKSRRSVRGFHPEPIPTGVIEALFMTAGRAPSNCNVQPWITHVVSGESLKRVRKTLVDEATAGRLDLDVPMTDHYVDQYKVRRIDAAVALFEAVGVARDDTQARQRSMMRNFELFDAPHAAFFFMPGYFGMREAVDLGIYVQTLMLALTAHGYGSCAQGAISFHAGALKRDLGIEDDLTCMLGMSFGRPDYDHPSARATASRAPLSEVVVLHN